MKTNQEYKNEALAALKGKWAPAVLCAVVYFLIAGGVSLSTEVVDESSATGVLMTAGFAAMILSLLVAYPLGVGYYNVHKDLLLGGDDKMTANTFRIGFTRWAHNVWGMFLMTVFILLWSILLFIPGIIKAFAYALTPYILVERPELSANEAIDLSKAMMKGHKFDLFWLGLSFIGWGVLTILTAGIGIFWLMPYMYTAYAAFYQDVKAEYETKSNSNN
jgi:uncharacterized membrane protein